MQITINIYYTGAQAGNAAAFAEEMEQRGIADRIREEKGNLRYAYFTPLHDAHTVLLIDSWADAAALDAHHASPMMADIAAMREKYDLHMRVERFFHADEEPDSAFIRKCDKQTNRDIEGIGIILPVLKEWRCTEITIPRRKST